MQLNLTTTQIYKHSLTRLVIGLFLLVCNVASIASENELQPYKADYSLYIDGLHIGNSQFSLVRSDNLWHWETRSEPRGIYKILTKKKPYSKTTFTFDSGRHLIQEILLSDTGDKNAYQLAKFDWLSGQAEILHKKQTTSVALKEDVYDNQSAIWLAINMMNTTQTERQVDFYTSGKIVKATIKRVENQTLINEGKSISAWVYEQTEVNSPSKMRYYLDPDKPLPPLKIEQIQPKKRNIILVLKTVKLKIKPKKTPR